MSSRAALAVLVLLLGLVACGQKDGVRQSAQVAFEGPPAAAPAASPAPTNGTDEQSAPPEAAQPVAAVPARPGAGTAVSSAEDLPVQVESEAPVAPPVRATTPAPERQEPEPAPAQTAVDPAEPDYGAMLDGHRFVSTEVSSGGQTRPLVEGTEITIEFERRSDSDVVRWRAGCNHFGAAVAVTERVLDVVPNSVSTAVGCNDDLQAQDEWLTTFMESDPAWSLDRDSGMLTLTADDTVLRLRATA